MRKRRRENKNRQKRKVIESTANYLIDNLKREGIVIQKYESMGTLSIYLKLDYGILNSIRISDHKGKKLLSYKYNLLTICSEPFQPETKHIYKNHLMHGELAIRYDLVLLCISFPFATAKVGDDFPFHNLQQDFL